MRRRAEPGWPARAARALLVLAIGVGGAGCTPLATRVPELPAAGTAGAAAAGYWVLVEEAGARAPLAGRALFVFTRPSGPPPVGDGATAEEMSGEKREH